MPFRLGIYLPTVTHAHLLAEAHEYTRPNSRTKHIDPTGPSYTYPGHDNQFLYNWVLVTMRSTWAAKVLVLHRRLIPTIPIYLHVWAVYQ